MASWPPLLRADTCAAMLNFEIADHPVYNGLELQWFNDAAAWVLTAPLLIPMVAAICVSDRSA